MKKVKITVIMDVTDEYYDKDIKSLEKDILTGKHQREMLEYSKGLKTYKASICVLKK